MPLIDRESPTPFYQQVYEQIARGIDEGHYKTGEKLPSIRKCAHDLGVSNTTVELAYQRLTEEGYVEARRGSGYAICVTPAKTAAVKPKCYAEEYEEALRELEKLVPQGDEYNVFPTGAPITWDFAYDSVDPAAFPYSTWARISRNVFFCKGSEAACLYNDPQGLFELREQIAHYLGKEHEITAEASQILILPTTRDLVADIMSLFDPAETAIFMEEPGYDEVATKLGYSWKNTHHLTTYPLLRLSDLEEHPELTKVLFLTPACQFPTNQAMSIETRKSLVEWAERSQAYILDDEYGWEFQTGLERMPSLGALDQAGRVITLGTFSNAFTPAACLSFAVLPPQLMLKWRREKGDAHPKVPWQTQAAMAQFMSDGHWRTHMRKMRTLMAKKRQVLLDAIEKHLGDTVQLLDGASNSFILAQTLDGRSEHELIELAADAGVRVHPTRRYWSGNVPDDWRYVLIGYSSIGLDDIAPGIEALAKAWLV